jgi:hypothetical protein
MVISRKREVLDHPVLYLDNSPITRVTHHKHLGLNISQDLTWGLHITEITDKANRRLGILRSLKYKLNKLSIERIYFAFIRPILEYGDVVWDNISIELSNLIEKVQLNAARIVVGATAKCSSEGLYSETAWDTLKNRRLIHSLSLMYKIVNKSAPQYLIDTLPQLIGDRTGYRLRNREDLDPIRARINIYANSFFPKTVNEWNKLDRDRRVLPSIEAFKSNYRRRLPKKNPLYYFGGRLEASIHARMRIKNSPLKNDFALNFM